jgi:hypothetical protein
MVVQLGSIQRISWSDMLVHLAAVAQFLEVDLPRFSAKLREMPSHGGRSSASPVLPVPKLPVERSE